MGDAKALRADTGKNGATNFRGQRFGGEYASFFSREILYKLGGNVRRGERNGCREAPLFADCIERGEENVRADGKVNVFFIAAFDAPDDNCSGESRVLQDTLSNKSRNLAR